jgi:energy-coupling factor transporter ATP-binding protein EcfA2
LDEQFTWIDSNSKEAILEFYRSKSHNKSYFIVDHASEFNAAVDSRILVRKKNGIAQVEQ